MDLKAELSAIVDADRVLTRTIDRIAFANDASVYRLVPRAVVLAGSVSEIQSLFRFSRSREIPLTFRAAGTSLSGQAVTDGILVVLSRHWRGIRVEEQGRKVRVQPGVIGGDVNRHLRPYGTKIGPDPASIQSCMIGGILANNSSGMCCGVTQNAYHTLESIHFVLPDGLELDTADPRAEEKLLRESPRLAQGLLDLKRRIERNEALRERIRSKYRMKNTNGYSLNAFLDYARPLEILAHLMIGSEGTLGFIAGAVLDTVPDYPLKYTGLLFFPDVPRACGSIAPLGDTGARALELMDRASLRAIENEPVAPSELRELPREAAALLAEYQCETDDELARQREACHLLLPRLPLLSESTFTTDPEARATLWSLRKGLIPSVGAMRKRGTSFIIEDVVFPVERLAEGVSELQRLFAEHGYDDAIVFGHAKDGNLHFVLTQSFQKAGDVKRYDAFMRDLAVLVAERHGGALKAEHGTGRNMAPFVAAEWGEDAREIMRELKRLVDPPGLLNPGVILNDDPEAHLTHLKPLPTVEDEVDPCIECGFCERMCPSRDLTLTPRQRIVVRREMARLRESDPRSPLLRELEADYRYAGVETCAADGLCATACPVGLDTGRLIKRLRRQGRSAWSQAIARRLARHFALLEAAARTSLRAARIARAAAGSRATPSLPLLRPEMPRAASGARPATSRQGASAVYFPSCTSRVLGASDARAADPPIIDVLVAVSARAGSPLWIPDGLPGHCCGMAFSSKGYDRASTFAINRTIESLWSWSNHGELPVVVDSSPCAFTLKQARDELTAANRERYDGIEILDSIEFAHDRILARLAPRALAGTVVLHPVCSVDKMGLGDKLLRVVEAYAGEAEVPLAAGCCGFAGDRGFTVPELTAAATRAEAAEVTSRGYRGYYSSSRTCEIGLARATGRPYRSFWHLLDETTRG